MNTEENASGSISQQQINVRGGSVPIATAGNSGNQAILFLHGYPQNWKTFEGVMNQLKDTCYVIALDLPGIGNSEPIASSDKRSIATFINDVIETLNLKQIVLAGHDIGGMVTWSFIKLFPEKLLRAIIMNTAIPGVAPWEEVKRSPYIWHFAMYAVPSLPEIVFAGKQRILFDYFYNTLSADKYAISEHNRAAYAQAYDKPSALKTSFDWYRAFPQDEKHNAGHSPVDVPVLYLRGEKDPGDMNKYVEGLKQSGLNNIRGELIPRSGHFAPEEQAELVAGAIRDFIAS